ncbi:MAG TPA: methyltransferase domain-containing protein [Stellaceae bacterium]|nr:methyltransferase domain-containing protein [Stellaceae bacterium]
MIGTVARRFGRAAVSYDGAAELQRGVADDLMTRIRTLDLPRRPRVLEIGCGTGLLSRQLAALDPVLLCLTDIAPEMARMAAARQDLASPLVMDGARPCFAEGSFDLIAASMSMQWFDEPAMALPRLCALLAPGGTLAFAALAGDNFPEWRQALADARLPAGVQRFTEPSDWLACLPEGATVEESPRLMRYADAGDFLASLKRIGADMPVAGYRPLPPGALRRVMRRFETGLAVTYNIVYGVYRRPNSSRLPLSGKLKDH